MSRTFTNKDYSNDLLQQLWQLRESEDSCDVQLIVGADEKRILAHRCIISAASTYFRRILHENTSSEIQLPQLDGVVLYSLIEYCYTGHIVITIPNVKQLLTTAKFLFLDDVASACANFIAEKFHPSNMLKSILPAEGVLAITHYPHDLNEKYIQFYCQQQSTWTTWPKSFKFNERSSIAKIEDNLYVLGGKDEEDDVTNDVLCIVIKTMHLKEVAKMTECRTNCGAAVLKGFLFAIGGYSTSNCTLKCVEKFCPQTNKWCEVASMNFPKWKLGLAVCNGKLYVLECTGSNREFECYDPDKNKWIYLYSFMEQFNLTGQMTIAIGKVCKIGTFDGKASVAYYDPETNNCGMATELPGHLSSLFATGLWTTFSDKIIVCHDNTIVEYDDKNKQWKTDTTLGLPNVDYVFSYGHHR